MTGNGLWAAMIAASGPMAGTGMAALALCAMPAPAAAQEDKQPTAQMQAAVVFAEQRGRQLYLYDQAAWHGTDRFLEEFDLERDAEFMRGYIVVPGEGDLLDTIFFGDFGDGLVEAARYSVDGSAVVGGGVLPADRRPALSATAQRMAAARQAAIEEMVRGEHGMCADSNPNTIALPPDADGNIEVYILTPPTSNEEYPLGGHYRFEIGPAGEVVAQRRFLNSCFALSSAPRDEDGETLDPIGLVVSHLLDPQPTEIHVFANLNFPLPLMVMTIENDSLWSIERGDIEYAGLVGE